MPKHLIVEFLKDKQINSYILGYTKNTITMYNKKFNGVFCVIFCDDNTVNVLYSKSYKSLYTLVLQWYALFELSQLVGDF